MIFKNSYLYNNYNNNKPSIIYENSLLNKKNIYKDNKNKSGIYRWINRITNDSYIGSSNNLTRRFQVFFSEKYLKNWLLKCNSHIYEALLKYGYWNFNLEILEYCDKDLRIKREQYYMDLLEPEYNILKFAGSRTGSKHSLKALLKLEIRGYTTNIINKKDNTTKEYNSIRAAARSINCNHVTLSKYINKDKYLKGIYLIKNPNFGS